MRSSSPFLLPFFLGLFSTTGCASTAPTRAVISPAPPASAAASLPFIEDDYPRALAEARAAHKPLFVDAWATWCHTCLSMRAYTFRDAKVRAHAGELVWASIDTEKPANAAWVASHPMHAWPTLFVVDASTGATMLEWPSSATADELVALLARARASTPGPWTGPGAAEGAVSKADARAHAGDAAAAAGKNDEAIAAWREALAIAPVAPEAEWPARAATVESVLDRLLQKKDYAACADAAAKELPKVKVGGARAATLELACVEAMPAGEARRPLVDRAIERARTIAADAADPMLADDRSALYEAMADLLASDGRDAEAKGVARSWSTYLDGEAARAPDAAARAVFDAHRLGAYLALGTPERALPMLEASARDFPTDYNPPARLARAYLAMRRYDDALAAIDRALGLVYGPRSLRLYATKADVLEAKGDRTAAAAALKDGVARAKAMSLPPRYASVVSDLERRITKLTASQ